MESDPGSYDSFTRQAVSLCDSVDWTKLQGLPGMFRSLTTLLRPSTLSLPADVRKTTAVIEEPSATSDNAIKFTAGLATTVTLVATIHNLEDTNRVSILVKSMCCMWGMCDWTCVCRVGGYVAGHMCVGLGDV